MAIKKVQLPDNSTQDINDSRIGSADITKWNGKEDTTNKVTSLSASSTDTQYPSAKVVYDELDDKVSSSSYDNIVSMSKTDFDALATKDGRTMYIVDDPNGAHYPGNEYRLIASGTTSADMVSINITTDTNGDPFELKEVLVYARIRGNSVGYTGWFKITVDSNSWSMVQDSGAVFAQFAASGDNYYTVLGTFYKLGNRVFPKNCYRSWNTDSIKDSLCDAQGSSMWSLLEEYTNANFTDNIKRIRMGGYDNGGVGAGSEYWVYGIDA